MSLATEFGLTHHAYRRFRPRYPRQLYDRVLDSLDRPRALAVDLGAGTGLVSLELGGSFQRVVAVEPDPDMAAHLRETAPTAELQAVAAERAQFEPASVDLVTCANAFHWMAGREVAAAVGSWLGEGGLFAGWRYPMPAMPAVVADLVRDELARWAGFLDRRTLDMRSMQTSFGERPEFELLADEVIPNVIPMNVDALIGFLRSVSFIAAFLRSLEPDEAERYLEQIAERLRERIGESEIELDFPPTLSQRGSRHAPTCSKSGRAWPRAWKGLHVVPGSAAHWSSPRSMLQGLVQHGVAPQSGTSRVHTFPFAQSLTAVQGSPIGTSPASAMQAKSLPIQ
jgi:hypothetical protein